MKLIKYYTASCSICRAVERPVAKLASENDIEYEKILVKADNDLNITSVPTFVLIDDRGNKVDTIFGGGPSVLVKKLDEKIKELK